MLVKHILPTIWLVIPLGFGVALFLNVFLHRELNRRLPLDEQVSWGGIYHLELTYLRYRSRIGDRKMDVLALTSAVIWPVLFSLLYVVYVNA